MAKTQTVAGATSIIQRVFIQDSSSTTGAGLTGLAFNTANLVCYRARDDDGNAGGTAISLVTATRGTWVSGGFVEKDATNMPGVYELHLPNSALAAGSKTVTIELKGATNMAPCLLEIELTAWNNQDAVRGGLTALPNVVAGGNGGLVTADANNSGKIQAKLKKNTAFNNFMLLMTDSTTHNPKPGLGTGVTATRSLDGAAFGATTNTVTELSNGIYLLNLAAADTNADIVTLRFTAAASDDLFVSFTTVP